MAKAFQLRSRKWRTVNTRFAFWPRKFTMHVNATRPVKWRRFDIIPGWGSFNAQKNSFLVFGFIQVRCSENRTCTITDRGEPFMPPAEALDEHEVEKGPAPSSLNMQQFP